jgi:hypothetical protein
MSIEIDQYGAFHSESQGVTQAELVTQRFATSHHLDGFLKVRAFWKAKTQLLNSDFMALR